jgi:hypothetical protein
VVPPSVVARTTAALNGDVLSPTTQQFALVTHDTPKRAPIPYGRCWDFQVLPPLLVVTMPATPDEVLPTAQQWVLVGQDAAFR